MVKRVIGATELVACETGVWKGGEEDSGRARGLKGTPTRTLWVFFVFHIYRSDEKIMITFINDTLIRLIEVTMTSRYLNNLIDLLITIWRVKPKYYRNCNKLYRVSGRRDLNLGHIGERWVLSPLRHPCSLNFPELMYYWSKCIHQEIIK